MWSFEINSVESLRPPGDLPFDFSLDRPCEGARLSNTKLEVAGWVLGRDEPASAVVVSVNARQLGAIPVALKRADVVEHFQSIGSPWLSAAGFEQVLQLEPVPGPVELDVAVEIGGRLVPVRRVRGVLSSRYSPAPTRFAPLMLTAHGRSGTTVVMQALCSHPEIAATRVHPFELQIAQHMVDTLRQLLDYRHSQIVKTQTDFLEDEFARASAAFITRQIDAYYERIAALNGQPAARYLVEKFLLDGPQRWFNVLYPGTAREIFLVRDFRDVFASVAAFNARRGNNDFIVRYESQRETAFHWKDPRLLLEQRRERKDSSLLLRYEDVVTDPGTTLRRVFAYLGVDASPRIVDIVSENLRRVSSEGANHRTSSSAEASIGRWKKDLAPDVVDALHDSIGEVLVAFGYEVPSEVADRFRPDSGA